MKRILVIFVFLLFLCGCGVKETVETVADEWMVPAMAQPKSIRLVVPGEASVCTMESDTGRLYIGDCYEIAVQTLSAGDLDATLRSLSGFSVEELTVMRTMDGSAKRYEFVWTAAGEKGERLGRGIILDDGDYHYCLSVLRDMELPKDCQVVWSEIYQSFGLEEY